MEVHDEAWISRLYHLKVDTTTRDGDGSPHEKPHKIIHSGLRFLASSLSVVPWCQELGDRFSARFEIVKKLNDRNNPDLPFRYLAGDGIWLPLEADGTTPVRREIRVADQGQVFARFTDKNKRTPTFLSR